MIRIAIVEDEKRYAEEIAGYCRRYSAEKETEISSRWFDNPVDFLEKYRGDVELVFMDVLMPLMDGMTCARRPRPSQGQSDARSRLAAPRPRLRHSRRGPPAARDRDNS